MHYRDIKSQLDGWKPSLAGETVTAGWLPAEPKYGLFSSNAAFRLAAKARTSPGDVVKTLVTDLNRFLNDAKIPLIARSAGAYINVRLTDQAYAALLRTDLTANLIDQDGRRVMLEYIGANVAKRLHAGHMRNLNIGEALRRLLELKYPRLITDNHWGDWGVQFGVLLWAYKQGVDKEAYQKNPLDELQRLYVWGNRQKGVVSDWDEAVRSEFVKLEQGDKQNRQLWEEFVQLSKRELEGDLQLMNVKPVDLDQGESFYEPDMRWLSEFMDRHELWQREGKARYIDFAELPARWPGLEQGLAERISQLGRSYLVSSDGYTTYVYRDVAARLQWARDHKVDLAITITDKRQQHNFDQAFSIIAYLAAQPEFTGEIGGEVAARLRIDHLVHVPYGFLKLVSGRMSTREGNVLGLGELTAEVETAALDALKAKNPHLEEVEAARRSRVIAVASLKWADLDRDPQTDVVLDPAKIVQFEGNTGTYQLYTYARLRSIERKAGKNGQADDVWRLGQAEAEMLDHIFGLAAVMETAISEYRPHLLSSHVRKLATVVNSWYNVVPIVKEPDLKKRAQLLALVGQVSRYLAFSLSLLGIEVLEEL